MDRRRRLAVGPAIVAMIAAGKYKVLAAAREAGQRYEIIADLIISKGDAKLIITWAKPHGQAEEIPVRWYFININCLRALPANSEANFSYPGLIDLDAPPGIVIEASPL